MAIRRVRFSSCPNFKILIVTEQIHRPTKLHKAELRNPNNDKTVVVPDISLSYGMELEDFMF